MNLFYLTIILAYLAHASAQELTVSNGGEWGEWASYWGRCRSVARGFKQKIEAPQGSSDDTGLNDIGLLCNYELITSEGGNWGGWGKEFYCPDNGYLVAFSLKVEESQGMGDDTAANEIKFRCSNGEIIQDPKGTPWGSWSPWSNSCHTGRGICWIATKIEDHQNELADDTALNDVKFLCCG